MEDELGFSVAPGAVTALSGLGDDRAYYTLGGDLSQMGTMEASLRAAGFPVVKSDVYPGFARDQEDEYRRALEYLFEHRVPGWWNQREALLRYGVCTQAEFDEALAAE